MKYCTKCGAELQDDAKFCGKCGAEQEVIEVVEAEETENSESKENTEKTENKEKSDFEKKFEKFMDTEDSTSTMDKKDIEDNKVMGILAYLSWLVLIPLLAAKDSKFARYHCNQGLVLAIVEIIWWILQGLIVNLLFLNIHYALYVLGTIIFDAVDIFLFVLAIIGIVNAAKGKARQVPIFGKFTILK